MFLHVDLLGTGSASTNESTSGYSKRSRSLRSGKMVSRLSKMSVASVWRGLIRVGALCGRVRGSQGSFGFIPTIRG